MALIEHLEKLRHFHKVTQFRSINEAASATGMSQAGFSKSIAALEASLEVSLFTRSNQGLILTKEGELVLRTTKTIISEASKLEASLQSLRAANVPKTFRIGMYDSVAVYFFGDLKTYLGAVYKTVKMELTVDTSSNLSAALHSKAIDLAVGVNLDSRPSNDSEFFLLFEDEYSFYVSARLEGRASQLPFIIHPTASDFEGTTVERHLANLILKNGAHRVYNFETVKTLTAQGFGIGVLPTQVAKPLLLQNQLVPVQIPKVRHTFGRHNIGFLASDKFLERHREFAMDLYRLGERWSKS